MGDIALPNVNYESQWQTQKLNKSFQQELERMKQEVYHEGLQVEEEGLTDIIRKKTKLFTNYDGDHGEDASKYGKATADNERHKNDPALLVRKICLQFCGMGKAVYDKVIIMLWVLTTYSLNLIVDGLRILF